MFSLAISDIQPMKGDLYHVLFSNKQGMILTLSEISDIKKSLDEDQELAKKILLANAFNLDATLKTFAKDEVKQIDVFQNSIKAAALEAPLLDGLKNV